MIVKITSTHCPSLATLHLAHLHSPFTSKAGHKLLTHYYRAMSKEQGAVGYVALEETSIQGYVCGVWNAGQLRKVLLRDSGVSLLFWGILQTLQKPSLSIDVLSRFRTAGNAAPETSGYELRPIVVTPKSRGAGLANTLVATLLHDAANRGFEKIHLFTEESNYAAIRFYQKFGFRQTGNIVRAGQVYQRYEYTTEEFA